MRDNDQIDECHHRKDAKYHNEDGKIGTRGHARRRTPQNTSPSAAGTAAASALRAGGARVLPLGQRGVADVPQDRSVAARAGTTNRNPARMNAAACRCPSGSSARSFVGVHRGRRQLAVGW